MSKANGETWEGKLIYNNNDLAAVWDAAVQKTAKRCKEIAQQRYLAENQAVDIDEKISAEFGV